MKFGDIRKMLNKDGFERVRQKGSHERWFKPPDKRVTIAGKNSDDVKTFTSKLDGIEIMKYLIIYEKTDTGYCAHLPDLDGACVAAGETFKECQQLIHDGLQWHLEWLREEGKELPEASAERIAEFYELAA